MLHRRHRHRSRDDHGELNITAFLNLMVILVPFLLITAVFSRLAILEVALPAPSQASPDTPEEEPLPPPTVLVRSDVYVLRAPDGTEVGFPRDDETSALAGLNSGLLLIKKTDLSKDAAVVLLEADVPYDTLIQVMDAVRLTDVDDGGTLVQAPLFPQISLGELPPVAGDAR